ncbi:hypothetical protein LJB91_04065 [Bacteroidales bacterium OttesenSCG-928-L03]|nr:hypothetical protein [Bacteroidales bacterium OttesenSCG-928-L03]
MRKKIEQDAQEDRTRCASKWNDPSQLGLLMYIKTQKDVHEGTALMYISK